MCIVQIPTVKRDESEVSPSNQATPSASLLKAGLAERAERVELLTAVNKHKYVTPRTGLAPRWAPTK